jgi:hypothetical protein
MTDITGYAKTTKDVAHNEKFMTETLSDKTKTQGQNQKDQKFPLDWDNPTEEEKKKWFREDEFNGSKVLKVKMELLPPPEYEGEPIFLVQKTSYKRPEQLNPTLIFEEDF